MKTPITRMKTKDGADQWSSNEPVDGRYPMKHWKVIGPRVPGDGFMVCEGSESVLHVETRADLVNLLACVMYAVEESR